MAVFIEVSKPMVKSVPYKSLSMVPGIPTNGISSGVLNSSLLDVF